MRTIRELHIEGLEERRAPAALGPALQALEHNPNMQDVYCITEPCPPAFDPGSARLYAPGAAHWGYATVGHKSVEELATVSHGGDALTESIRVKLGYIEFKV